MKNMNMLINSQIFGQALQSISDFSSYLCRINTSSLMLIEPTIDYEQWQIISTNSKCESSSISKVCEQAKLSLNSSLVSVFKYTNMYMILTVPLCKYQLPWMHSRKANSKAIKWRLPRAIGQLAVKLKSIRLQDISDRNVYV